MKKKLLLAGIDGNLYQTSLFFVLPTYAKINAMRSLHDSIVTALCQNPWDTLYSGTANHKNCAVFHISAKFGVLSKERYED